jgi:hypothetical protein
MFLTLYIFLFVHAQVLHNIHEALVVMNIVVFVMKKV